MNSIGAKLRRLRKSVDLSQDDLARALGYSRVQISNWEIERSEPDIEAINKLAKFFGVTTDHLTGADGFPDKPTKATDQPERSDPITEQIINNLYHMSPEEKEAFLRLSTSVVSRQTKGVS